MAKKTAPKGIVIDGKPSFRLVLTLGGVGDLKYALSSARTSRYTPLLESLMVLTMDYGDEGYPDFVGTIDITQFGAVGRVGDLVPRWLDGGLLKRMPKSALNQLMAAVRSDPNRDTKMGAGAEPMIAWAGYEVAQQQIWARFTQVIATKLGELGWPHLIVYVMAGSSGGTGRGLIQPVLKDLRLTLDTILANIYSVEADRQAAVTIVPVVYSWRTYSYQVFDEAGNLTDRADIIMERSNEAADALKQVIFVNGELNHQGMDLLLRQSPGIMRKVVNSNKDGNLPFAVLTPRCQTPRQVLRLAAYVLSKPTVQRFKREPVTWQVSYEPDGILEAGKAALGKEYRKKKVVTIDWNLHPVAKITRDLPLARLVKIAATYRIAQKCFDDMYRQHGDSLRNDNKVEQLRTQLREGNDAISRMISLIRSAAGNTGLYVYDWERPLLQAVLSLTVSEILQGVDRTLVPLPDFEAVKYLVGKGGKASIRDLFEAEDGRARLLSEMGSKWSNHPEFEDPGVEKDAATLAQMVLEALRKNAAETTLQAEEEAS